MSSGIQNFSIRASRISGHSISPESARRSRSIQPDGTGLGIPLDVGQGRHIKADRPSPKRVYVIASKRWPSSGYRLREVRAMGAAWASASSHSSLLGLNLEYLVAVCISSGIVSVKQINHKRRGRLSKRSEMAILERLRWKMVTILTAYRARLS